MLLSTNEAIVDWFKNILENGLYVKQSFKGRVNQNGKRKNREGEKSKTEERQEYYPTGDASNRAPESHQRHSHLQDME